MKRYGKLWKGYDKKGQEVGAGKDARGQQQKARSGVGAKGNRVDQKPIRKIEARINIKGELNRFPEIEIQKGVDIRGVIKASSHSRPRTT